MNTVFFTWQNDPSKMISWKILWKFILTVNLLCFCSGGLLWHFSLRHMLGQRSLSSAPQLPLPAHKSGLACNTYQLLCLQEISLRWPQNIITIFLSLASHTSFSSGLYQWPFPPLNIQITMYFEKTLPLWKLPFPVADHWLLYSHFSTIDSYHCLRSHSWPHWHKTTHWGQDSGLKNVSSIAWHETKTIILRHLTQAARVHGS